MGPISLDLALAPLAPVALGSHHCQTGNGYRLASQGLPLVLDLEMQTRQVREARVSLEYTEIRSDEISGRDTYSEECSHVVLEHFVHDILAQELAS